VQMRIFSRCEFSVYCNDSFFPAFQFEIFCPYQKLVDEGEKWASGRSIPPDP
jgi:hypothetical protein